MKQWTIAVGGFLFITMAAVAAPQPALQGIRRPDVVDAPAPHAEAQSATSAQPAPDAEGCVNTTMTCNSVVFGRLGAGDCTSQGKYVDFYKFQGRSGDYVEATIRTLSPSLTRPLIAILPPAGDASRTPVVYGGTGGATTAFVTSTSGTWTIAAGTDDLFGSGPYALKLDCNRDPYPQDPHSCFALPIICNQSAEWELTNQSCRWDDGSGVYNDFIISGSGGDVLDIEMTASGYTPVFGVYSADGSQLDSSKRVGTSARLSFFVPVTGEYHIAATAVERQATGPFTVKVSCANSGCLLPVLVDGEESVEVIVPAGERATLKATANSAGDVQYEWYDVDDMRTILGRGATFQTPVVTSRHIYQYLVKTRCGQTYSNLFFVKPGSLHHRSVRH